MFKTRQSVFRRRRGLVSIEQFGRISIIVLYRLHSHSFLHSFHLVLTALELVISLKFLGKVANHYSLGVTKLTVGSSFRLPPLPLATL